MTRAGFALQATHLVEALRAGRIDEADAMYQRLCEQEPKARDMLAIPVLIAIQRGQLLDALRLVDQHPAEHRPELRALCLRVLGDPSWHGEATALLDSPDPVIARAMRELLAVAPEPGHEWPADDRPQSTSGVVGPVSSVPAGRPQLSNR